MKNHLFWVAAIIMTILSPQSQGQSPVLEIETVIDLGEDQGQNFGSLFEARDPQGRVVFGAGFVGVYNTMFRNDRQTLQFFVRPANDDVQFAAKPLPRSTSDGGTYLFDLDGKVHSYPYIYEHTVRYWDDKANTWHETADMESQKMTHMGDGAFRLKNGLIKFWQSRMTFNGQEILSPPQVGVYHHPYYGQGHMIFFHKNRIPKEEGGFTRLYAVPWSPAKGGPLDLTQAIKLDLEIPGETPFSFGQFRKQLLTCSNQGGLYMFDGSKWHVLQNPKEYNQQIYSMINYNDKLMIAEYPTGHLWVYNGGKITELKTAPPVMTGVADWSREVQTTTIYRGDLYVGVWPWAELWRLDSVTQKWRLARRMFSYPELTAELGHPWEKEIAQYNKEHNAKERSNGWGQRITGLAAHGDSLLVGTMAYGGWKRNTQLSFLTDEVWAEYGRVTKLTLPGNLAAHVQWKDGPTTLRFIVTGSTMRIEQDGTLLGDVALPPSLAQRSLEGGQVKFGKGVFGPMTFKMVSHSIDSSASKK